MLTPIHRRQDLMYFYHPNIERSCNVKIALDGIYLFDLAAHE